MDKKKVLVIYHRVDYDGLFSYAIARKRFEDDGYEVEGFGYNYNDTVSFNRYKKNEYCKVVMCDISLPPNDMIEFDSEFKDDFIWIDHHITAIDNSVKYGYSFVNGVRDTSKAACQLSWEWFRNGHPLPYSVDLAATHDMWNKNSEHDWENTVATFQLGLTNEFGMNAQSFYDAYGRIIDEDDIEGLIESGRMLKKYTDGLFESWVNKYSFEVEVAGQYKAIAMLCPVFTSKVFNSVSDKGYDLYICAEKSGVTDGLYNISMYSDGAESDFSCGEYMAKNFNGGGHKGAAGGKMTEEQFIDFITKRSI